MVLIESLLVTISFFSTLPVPILDWTERRIRFIPVMMSFVGTIIGGIMFGVFYFINLEPIIMSILFIVLYTVLTGGLHNDALMDSSDAHFSRRDITRKLEIMTDSRVGAFAVMSYVNYILVFIVTMFYFFKLSTPLLIIIYVFMLSRLFVGFMNYNLKYAKEDGLAKMYDKTLVKEDKIILYVTFVLINVGLYFVSPYMLLISLIGITFYHMYKRFMYKQFNGITGDLLGTFILLSELTMLLAGTVIYIIF